MNQQQQAPIDPADDLISLILQCTSIAQNSDTNFLHLTGKTAIRAYQRPTTVVNMLEFLLSRIVDNSDLIFQLYMAMTNQGNYIDIDCEYQRQINAGLNSPPYKQWREIAETILKINGSDTFHFKRIYIMQQPFKVIGGQTRDQAIQEAKHAVALPEESNWDAVSYRIPPRGSAYFCMLFPNMLEKLQQSDIAIIDSLQLDVHDLLRQKFKEIREQDETQEDPFISDYSIFLESRIAAVDDDEKKKAIQGTGDLKLIQYVISSIQAFIQGIIPGSIAPGLITACQDIVSMTELQAAVQSIGTQQITQAAEIMPNPAVRRGIRYGAEKSNLTDGWTVQQVGSLNQAASITQQLTANFRDPIDPQQKLEQQLAGGANTLIDQFNMQWQDSVVRLTPLDSEMLRQGLSLMLASIRLRFDATQNTKDELVSQEDIDHLYICERLAQYVEPNAQEFFKRMCSTLILATTEGHNKLKLAKYGPAQEVVRDAMSLVIGKAEVILKAIALFDADLQEGGRIYFNGVISSILLSLCDLDRIDRQSSQRMARRQALFASVNNYR